MWNSFRIIFTQCENVKTFNISLFTVQNILKDSEDLAKSLSAREKAKNQHWVPVITRPVVVTAVKTGMIVPWKSLPGLRNTPEIIVCEHTSLCYPQMQVKALLCKEEAICEHCSLLWAKACSNWTGTKREIVLWWEELKFEIPFGNHECSVLRTKEERQ